MGFLFGLPLKKAPLKHTILPLGLGYLGYSEMTQRRPPKPCGLLFDSTTKLNARD
jgi:hypothetical protein